MEKNLEKDLFFIKNCDNEETQKDILFNLLSVLQEADEDKLPKTENVFIEFLTLYTKIFKDYSSLRPLIRKCKYDQSFIDKHEVLRKLVKIRKVSWDTNLTEIREIDTCKKNKYSVEKNTKQCVYEYDLQKICECNKDLMKKTLNDSIFINYLGTFLHNEK